MPATSISNSFSVYQFFDEEAYDKVREAVSAREAVMVAALYCDSVAARTGLTRKVTITDAGDCVVFEWRFGEGVVFPERESGL